MSSSWIWSDKITNERVARVGYNHFISNEGEWNNCFSKFSNRVLPPIFISTILQSVRRENLAHYFPYDVKFGLLADSRSFLANQKARNAIVGAENLLNNNYSMSPSWTWSDKITNEREARVGYNHFISNKGEWNNCFSKFAADFHFYNFTKRPERAYNFRSNAPRLPPSPDHYITKSWMKVTLSYANDNLSSTCGENQTPIIKPVKYKVNRRFWKFSSVKKV